MSPRVQLGSAHTWVPGWTVAPGNVSVTHDARIFWPHCAHRGSMSVCTVPFVPLTQFQFMTPAGLGEKYLHTLDPVVVEKFYYIDLLEYSLYSLYSNFLFITAHPMQRSRLVILVLNLKTWGFYFNSEGFTEKYQFFFFNKKQANIKTPQNNHLLEKLLCAAAVCVYRRAVGNPPGGLWFHGQNW